MDLLSQPQRPKRKSAVVFESMLQGKTRDPENDPHHLVPIKINGILAY